MAHPISEELQEQIRKRYVRGVFGYRQVAEELGIGYGTVRRYVSEEARERDRRYSRAYKAKTTGVCERCGGETRYNGHGSRVSSICITCARTFTHCIRGHLLTPENRLDTRTQGHACRICRNQAMRERRAEERRAAGVPERKPYARPVEAMLLANQEAETASEEAAP